MKAPFPVARDVLSPSAVPSGLIVTEAVTHALFDPKPRRRYLVGTRWEGNRVIHALIERLLDANESPAHGYSRAELIAILDEHSARRS